MDAKTGRRIGLLWGDFPWEERARKVGKLLSMGALGRVTAQALRHAGQLVPYQTPPSGASDAARRDALETFLSAIDVLWADVYSATEPALRLRQELRLRCPVVLFAGGAMPKAADAMLFPWRQLLRLGDGIWFTCEADRTIWRRLVRWSALHEWVVPVGVDETLFCPRPPAERAAARARYGLPRDAPLLLSVGRLNIQKNLHTLLQLLAAVRREVPHAHLCFAGEEDDIVLGEFGVRNTGYVSWLHQRAADFGLADAVTFVGPRFGEDLARLYGAADVVVSGSFYHRENFGLALAEAQACGVPVVCPAWGGLKEVVKDGETGYFMESVLTKHGIRLDWATGAERVMALLRDPVLRAETGAKARAWAQERFGLAAFSTALRGLAAQAGHPPAGTGGGRPRLTTGTVVYEPSTFAEQYEAHKRACGWYADLGSATRPYPPMFQGRSYRLYPPMFQGRSYRLYPPMFQGRSYRLYERMMGPYATRLAQDLAPGAIAAEWIPYFPSPVTLDSTRHIVENCDPVWPHRRFCGPQEWAIVRRVDGPTPVGALTAAAAAEWPGLDQTAVASLLWQFYVEGFMLFRRPKRDADETAIQERERDRCRRLT